MELKILLDQSKGLRGTKASIAGRVGRSEAAQALSESLRSLPYTVTIATKPKKSHE